MAPTRGVLSAPGGRTAGEMVAPTIVLNAAQHQVVQMGDLPSGSRLCLCKVRRAAGVPAPRVCSEIQFARTARRLGWGTVEVTREQPGTTAQDGTARRRPHAA